METEKVKKISTKGYNTTDLEPYDAIERNIVHRDMLSHIWRWSFVLKNAKSGEDICDFGCGKGNLMECFYRNKYAPKRYVGLDIRSATIEKNKEKFGKLGFADFYAVDLIKGPFDFKAIQASKVCSFECLEHVGKQNVDIFLTNFRDCGKDDAVYYLSTPCFNGSAAGNHTYDSGDGRGVAPQEFEHFELQAHLEKYFTIEKKFGTFASQSDYKPLMNEWQTKMFEALQTYYDTNLIANIMAPMFPEQSRNCLWVLRRKEYLPETAAAPKQLF